MKNKVQLKELVVATNNAHKLTELRAILEPLLPNVAIKSLKEYPAFPEPEEDGQTFIENARIKAAAALEQTSAQAALADDSGLMVDALGGAPGVLSARWAGEHGNDAANNEKLLRLMRGREDRKAQFHCSIVLMYADGSCLEAEGECPGSIAESPRGEAGFGYDPLFLPDARPGKSMAELEPEDKNSISHRSAALQCLGQLLQHKAF